MSETQTARAYAQENRDKAMESEKAARERAKAEDFRSDRHAAAYWHGYATAMAAVVASIDNKTINGLY